MPWEKIEKYEHPTLPHRHAEPEFTEEHYTKKTLPGIGSIWACPCGEKWKVCRGRARGVYPEILIQYTLYGQPYFLAKVRTERIKDLSFG